MMFFAIEDTSQVMISQNYGAKNAQRTRAFLKTESFSDEPTFITVIFAPIDSFIKIALVRQNSSRGLIINVTPFLSNLVLDSVKLIFEVVSGTTLMHTRIFIFQNYIIKFMTIYLYVIQFH